MSAFWLVMLRDMRLAARRRGGLLQSLAFCLLMIALFPLAFGSGTDLLRLLGGGIIWIAALMVSLLNLPQLFEDDFEDGSLEATLETPHGTAVLIGAKLAAHWLTGPVVLALFSPFFAMLLGLESGVWPHLAASLALGGALLTVIGALGGALALGVRKAWLLLSLLVLPLYIPVLIFALATLGDAPHKGYMGLGFLLLILLPVTLIASVAALKTALEDA